MEDSQKRPRPPENTSLKAVKRVRAAKVLGTVLEVHPFYPLTVLIKTLYVAHKHCTVLKGSAS